MTPAQMATVTAKLREYGVDGFTYVTDMRFNDRVNVQAKANLKLYGQRVWEKIRASQLSRQPLCGRCQSEGKITAANHVDHVFPHRRDPAKFRLNLFQSLCAGCHTLKTQDESKGIYLHYTAHGVVQYTDDDYVRMVGLQYKDGNV